MGALTEHAREVRRRFSPDRWRSFVDDNALLPDLATPHDYIEKIRKDHGYNPTPTWTFTARLVSRWVRPRTTALTLLAWTRPAAARGHVRDWYSRPTGAGSAASALIVFGLGTRGASTGSAAPSCARTGWRRSAIAVCLLRRGRRARPAGLLAYAAMVRVFPGGFLVGPRGPRRSVSLMQRRPPAWLGRLARLRGSESCSASAPAARPAPGPGAWPEFAHNLEQAPRHLADQQRRPDERRAVRRRHDAARGRRLEPARAVDHLAGQDEPAPTRVRPFCPAAAAVLLASTAAAPGAWEPTRRRCWGLPLPSPRLCSPATTG